jgi:hypothetical protein
LLETKDNVAKWVSILCCLLSMGLSSASASAQSRLTEPANALAGKPWNIGVFGTGGLALGYRDVERQPYVTGPEYWAPVELQFFNAGVHVGKILTPPIGPSIIHGQFELGADVLPFWQAHYPPQALQYHSGSNGMGLAPLGAKNRFGMSVTPFLCRWNFSNAGRFVPWVQAGGGILWTNHKFPQYPNKYADTSVINFTPHAGFGLNVFVKPRRSIFVAANAVHISSASLGDHNPGVNVTAQFSLGYSWWK